MEGLLYVWTYPFHMKATFKCKTGSGNNRHLGPVLRVDTKESREIRKRTPLSLEDRRLEVQLPSRTSPNSSPNATR